MALDYVSDVTSIFSIGRAKGHTGIHMQPKVRSEAASTIFSYQGWQGVAVFLVSEDGEEAESPTEAECPLLLIGLNSVCLQFRETPLCTNTAHTHLTDSWKLMIYSLNLTKKCSDASLKRL